MDFSESPTSSPVAVADSDTVNNNDNKTDQVELAAGSDTGSQQSAADAVGKDAVEIPVSSDSDVVDVDHAPSDEILKLELKDDGADVAVEVIEAMGSEKSGEGVDGDEIGVENERDSETDSEEEEEERNEGGENGVVEKEKEKGGGWHQYPLRPEAEDCSFYMKTGSCKFGANCKFNHPVRRKTYNQFQGFRDKMKDGDEFSERRGQTECKYYLRPEGCKYGKGCRYIHGKGKTQVTPIEEHNFLGLPIRQGEIECPYYMRTGSCKYGSNCKYNHPDPTAAGGGSDPPSGFGNGVSASLQGGSQSSSWSAPRSLNETPPYVVTMVPPSQGVPFRNTEWNDYQAPIYRERSMPAPPPYVINNSGIETNVPKQYPQSNQVDEFPERPGQPLCTFFLRTGDCKFRSNCKYHHPKLQTAVSPSFALSDKGLPLRPDQSICMHYSRYGICKFGPACKFDHPLHVASSTSSGLDRLPFSDLANTKEAEIGRSRSRTDDINQLQQAV